MFRKRVILNLKDSKLTQKFYGNKTGSHIHKTLLQVHVASMFHAITTDMHALHDMHVMMFYMFVFM